MGIRSLVQLSIVAMAFALAPSAFADIPNPTTGSGGSTTTTPGTGGAASKYNPDCTISLEQQGGTTCQECNPSTTCGGLGKEYVLACQSSATAAVYCNGPVRETPSDQNVACSVSVPGGSWGGAAAGGALAVAAALMMRRRRRA